MEIIMRPMTEEEVWNFLIKRHHAYHTNLKNYGYGYSSFIPKTKSMHEMFSKETLSDEDIKKYRESVTKLYDVEQLKRLDGIFAGDVKQKIADAANEVLSTLLSSWDAVLPENLEILCTYGNGGSYYVSKDGKYAQIVLRMSRMQEDKNGLFGLLTHEFIHILIQRQIIDKYHVPQDLKERIVDIIGLELFQKPVQSKFTNSFANAYITPETIKTDLTGAVAKMMADYTAMQQK